MGSKPMWKTNVCPAHHCFFADSVLYNVTWILPEIICLFNGKVSRGQAWWPFFVTLIIDLELYLVSRAYADSKVRNMSYRQIRRNNLTGTSSEQKQTVYSIKIHTVLCMTPPPVMCALYSSFIWYVVFLKGNFLISKFSCFKISTILMFFPCFYGLKPAWCSLKWLYWTKKKSLSWRKTSDADNTSR